MDVIAGQLKNADTEELIPLNCGLEKILESPLNCKEIKGVKSKGNQP